MSDATTPRGRVLIIAGSDSGGGAGIQADIKSVTALGGYAMTAITALTAQNTEGVADVMGVAPEFIAEQMRLVLSDLGADTLKTGMLHNRAVIETVADVTVEMAPDTPLVVDPVMYAKGGHALLEPDAVDALTSRMLPIAALLTPNAPEAEAIAGMTIDSAGAMTEAARRIAGLGAAAVLVKGGHLPGDPVCDILYADGVIERFSASRIDTRHTHGTGCTLASAIAAGLAHGLDMCESVRRARDYVRLAMLTAPGFGRGHGPLNHGHTVSPFDPERNLRRSDDTRR